MGKVRSTGLKSKFPKIKIFWGLTSSKLSLLGLTNISNQALPIAIAIFPFPTVAFFGETAIIYDNPAFKYFNFIKVKKIALFFRVNRLTLKFFGGTI